MKPYPLPKKATGNTNIAEIHADIPPLQNNPEQALNHMVKTYGGLVYTVVRGVLPTTAKEEIEECVADTFIYVYEHRNRLDFSKGSIKAYLCSAARSRALDRLRKLKRQDCAEQSTDSSQHTAPSAEELALLRAERRELIDAIRTLGDPDAKILIYRYYLNMKSAEIAELLGIKQNTVDQRAGRALKKLARNLTKGDRCANDES